MTDQKPASSVLDGLILGEPISNHHGVRCCPAIRENSDEKYIVKIISIPATQSQLDALLLTGACTDQAQALAYFKELAEGVAGEAAVLRRLSALEGFDAHEEYELQQMPRGVGYQVYLLGRYKPSLATLMREKPLTHLAAVNLGLDLCAALTACRRLGYLYVDLRPENIFFCENQGYRIGDLGFIPMASLRYASLPEKYRSRYTAPEIGDAMSALNDTMDLYAAGLILYQVYNNGQLPFETSVPATGLPAPLYADYEMAEIILKACAPDPRDRWQDPAQMGQALVNYMQRNSVNDTPIIPPPIVIDEPEDEPEAFLSEEENDKALAQLLADLPEEIAPEQMSMDGQAQTLTAEDIPEPEEPDAEEPIEADADQLSFLESLTDDETAPSDETSAELDGTDVTDEVAQMLAQADDLIAHELPEPVVAPGPIDVPIPPPVTEAPEEDEPEDAAIPVPIETETEPEEEAEEDTLPYDAEDEYIYDQPVKRRAGRWIALAAVVLFLLAAVAGGYIWYNEWYLQPIEALSVQGSGDVMTVTVVSGIDEDLLTVICTDTYGNTLRSPVVGGTATFTGLTPSTQYRIRVEISGLHKLVGSTMGIYTTDAQTQIMNFTAVFGPEDGSVVLNFSVNGPDTDLWSVVISAPGQSQRTQEFSGHTVTVYGLTAGTDYTFRLEGGEDMQLAGERELTFTAQNILYAQDLQVTACGGGSLSVQWTDPTGTADQLWHLRCYNDAGYDETVSTTDTGYTFTGLDHATGYTVLVTADGMPQSTSASVTAEPINVVSYTGDVTAPGALTVQWEFTGAAPENGWIFRCRINDGEEITLSCPSNQATLALVSGYSYEFTAQPVDDITCFTQSGSYTAEEAQAFEGFGITAADLAAALVLRPEGESWGYTDLTAESYKTEFTAGETAAVLIAVGTNFTLSDDQITVTFAIRDADTQLVSAEQLTMAWSAMWQGIYCPLELGVMPAQPGSYTLDLYFGEQIVTSLSFTIV